MAEAWAAGMRDKHQATEEADEAKASRLVLAARQGGDTLTLARALLPVKEASAESRSVRVSPPYQVAV
ncbi:MAG: hypothetical protein LDL41_04715 [Coleofasciculus sp. S288]|nr:hypothetical protein [Coleofasciculus sp. S288]